MDLNKTILINLLKHDEKEKAISFLLDKIHFNKNDYFCTKFIDLVGLNINYYSELIDCFNTIIYSNKTSNNQKIKARFLLCKLQLLVGDYNFAKKNLETLKKNNDIKNEVLLELSLLDYYNFNYSSSMHYLNKIPLDINNYYYFQILFNIKIKTNDYEGALSLFNDLNINSPHYIQIIYLEIKFKNYEKAYKHLLQLIKYNHSNYNGVELQRIEYFLSHKLNIKSIFDYKTYSINQMINYNKEQCLEHLLNHKNENEEKTIHSVFTKRINVNDLYDDIKAKLSTSKPYKFNLADKYLIDMNYTVGKVCDFKTTKLEVVTAVNTKDIITVYPNLSHYSLSKQIKK